MTDLQGGRHCDQPENAADVTSITKSVVWICLSPMWITIAVEVVLQMFMKLQTHINFLGQQFTNMRISWILHLEKVLKKSTNPTNESTHKPPLCSVVKGARLHFSWSLIEFQWFTLIRATNKRPSTFLSAQTQLVMVQRAYCSHCD